MQRVSSALFLALVALCVLLSLPITAAVRQHQVAVGDGPARSRVEIADGSDQMTVRQETQIRPPQAPAAPLPVPGGDAPGTQGSPTLPNLAPLPPYDVFVGQPDQPAGPVWSVVPQEAGTASPPRPARAALRFTTTIQNRGQYSFELVGLPEPAVPQRDLTRTKAYQCVRFGMLFLRGAMRDCLERRLVGALVYHAEHRHLHINGFGRYELRRDTAGQPDMSPAGRVRMSDKIGWCVSDMYHWREDEPAAQDAGIQPLMDYAGFLLPVFRDSWYSECTDPVLYMGASWRQGISPGWADTYPAPYTGQEIPLDGVPDGAYWIVVTINPRDNPHGLHVLETTWADNTAATKVEIYAGGTKARVVWPKPAAPYADWIDNPPDQPGD